MKLTPLAHGRAQQEAEDPRDEHLPGGGYKTVHREARAPGDDAADSPGEGTAEQRGNSPEAGAVAGETGVERRPQQSGQAYKNHPPAQPAAKRQRLGLKAEPFYEG